MACSVSGQVRREYGEYGVADLSDAYEAKAPRGYRPVYVSHVSRHGARYAFMQHYSGVHDVLEQAYADSNLTETGLLLRDSLAGLWPVAADHYGELTDFGREQLREMARMFYRRYRRVFRGKTTATAISTPVPRVRETMEIFIGGLTGLDRDLECPVDSSLTNEYSLNPMSSRLPDPYRVPVPSERWDAAAAYETSILDPAGWASRLFKDVSLLGGGETAFMKNLHTIMIDIPCMGLPDDAFGVRACFTDGEAMAVHDAWNCRGYLAMGPEFGCEVGRRVLGKMMGAVEEDLASGLDLHMYFTHDTGIIPLMSLLGVGTAGEKVSEPSEVSRVWDSSMCPMAANLQLVFYTWHGRRASAAGEKHRLLMKVVCNGRDVTLPGFSGPYVTWAEFSERFANFAGTAPGGSADERWQRQDSHS